jgi:iron(II)-dependent oxidoreductase
MTLPLQIETLLTPNDVRQSIAAAMTQCRQGTLELVAPLEQTLLTLQAHPDFSPIGWHLGHLAFTESLWILEHLAGQACPFPQYRQLFSADGLPKTKRQHLPSGSELHAYLATIREKVLDVLLHTAPLASHLRLWRWLLQHESQHCETITLIMALHRHQGRSVPSLKHPPVMDRVNDSPPNSPEKIWIPAGEFTLGSDGLDAIDNEQPQQTLYLEGYWIDATPVTCGQYQTFIAAGGYQTREWWSEAGWHWQQTVQVNHPLYWLDDPRFQDHPVCGVSWYEAEAYARFVGQRLPTEAEWEKAASWHPQQPQPQPYPWGHEPPTPHHCNHNHHLGHTTPVGQFSTHVSPLGCRDMLGNVWEWTNSWFAGYPGFKAYPYRGYSEVYFDQAHRVLRGGSWATRPWVLRNSFRNWYHPHVRELFMGFRCAQDT